MISALNGSIKKISPQEIIIEADPVHYTVYVPDSTRYLVDQPTLVHIYFHWSAEQGPSLYGFTTPLDKTVFTLLISCSGVGPKLGLVAIAQLGAQALLEAIQSNNVRALNSVTGIGTKKAEQIIISLKDKVASLLTSLVTHDKTLLTPATEQWHTLNLTLESLHYSRREIALALDYIKTNSLPPNPSFDQLLRKALSFLSKQSSP